MRKPTIIGQRFGRWLVLERTVIRGIKSVDTKFKCLCDCGNVKEVQYSNLKSGTSQSCGCRQKELVSKRSSRPNAKLRAKWNYYKRNALTRNIKWNLSMEESFYYFNGKCHYCGVTGLLGIDRVNNKLGYTLNNCVSCCRMCNQAKNDSNVSEFKAWIKRLYEHTYGVSV